jgi:Protein of unknown function (DUF2938)
MMLLARWALAGFIATLTMDVLGGVSRKIGVTHGAPPDVIGKWFMQVFRGHSFVADIRALPDPAPPLPLVLAIHYGIGISLALLFGVAGRMLGRPLSPWVAFAFGVGTTALPFFWMFPGMGFGVLGLHGPAEWKLTATALINHVYFGAGLALAAGFVVPRL